ncbi:MAG: protoporphyrinogen oxidase, partial [Propionicimonas sp.]
DTLSMAATMPALYRELRHERSLLAATRRVVSGGMVAAGARRGVPFRGVVGGVGRVPGAMAAALVGSGVQIRTRSTVRSIRPAEVGWSVEMGPPDRPEILRADAVVLATPAGPAATLLREAAPEAAWELARIEYASVAVAALAYRVEDVGAPLTGSGLLIPPVEGRAIKAVTYLDCKWGWVEGAAAGTGLRLLRVSVGRHGESAVLQRTDSELLDLVRVDLAYLLGIEAAPVDARVTRWGGALPQYAVGHRGVVERIRTGLRDAPTVAVCGAHLDGVGVAACVGSAHEASSRVLRGLAQVAVRG